MGSAHNRLASTPAMQFINYSVIASGIFSAPPPPTPQRKEFWGQGLNLRILLESPQSSWSCHWRLSNGIMPFQVEDVFASVQRQTMREEKKTGVVPSAHSCFWQACYRWDCTSLTYWPEPQSVCNGVTAGGTNRKATTNNTTLPCFLEL